MSGTESSETRDDKVLDLLAEYLTRTSNVFSTITWITSAASVGLSILIGVSLFLGYRSVGDLRTEIADVAQSKVESFFLKETGNNTQFANNFQDYLQKMREKVAEVEAAESKLSRFIAISELIEHSDPSQDPIGQFLALQETVGGDSEAAEEGLTDPGARLQAKQVLTVLVAAAEKDRSNIDSNELFNASGVASKLDFQGLARRLAQLAYDFRPIQIHKARLLRMTAAQAESLENEDSQKARDDAINEILRMIENLSLRSPELIVSEAWNVAERERRYDLLIEALENASARQNVYTPSYAHLIAARAYARQGAPGWDRKMNDHISVSLEKLANESPHSTWYADTIEDLVRMLPAILPSKHAGRILETISEKSRNIPALRQMMLRFGLLSEAN